MNLFDYRDELIRQVTVDGAFCTMHGWGDKTYIFRLWKGNHHNLQVTDGGRVDAGMNSAQGISFVAEYTEKRDLLFALDTLRAILDTMERALITDGKYNTYVWHR